MKVTKKKERKEKDNYSLKEEKLRIPFKPGGLVEG